MSHQYLVTIGTSHWLTSDPEAVGRIVKLIEHMTPARYEWINGGKPSRLFAPIDGSPGHELRLETLQPGQCLSLTDLEQMVAASRAPSMPAVATANHPETGKVSHGE